MDARRKARTLAGGEVRENHTTSPSVSASVLQPARRPRTSHRRAFCCAVLTLFFGIPGRCVRWLYLRCRLGPPRRHKTSRTRRRSCRLTLGGTLLIVRLREFPFGLWPRVLLRGIGNFNLFGVGLLDLLQVEGPPGGLRRTRGAKRPLRLPSPWRRRAKSAR